MINTNVIEYLYIKLKCNQLSIFKTRIAIFNRDVKYFYIKNASENFLNKEMLKI